jgi:acetylxylan esterase
MVTFTSLLGATALLAGGGLAAQLTRVDYPNNATSKAQMYVYPPLDLHPPPSSPSINAHPLIRYVYVPDRVVTNPPLVVVLHSCQSSAQSYFQNSKIPWRQGSDRKGYITVWPSSPNSGTCWDVSSRRSLSHNGGGDSQAIANMILYALDRYKADRSRVYVTGGSSGGMMSNVLAATYPELISAVSLYSGVPAGCFVSSSGQVAAWNNTCSGGQSRASAEQW